MQSTIVSQPSVLAQRMYRTGGVLTMVGGLMVLASAILVWQTHVSGSDLPASVVDSYYGGTLGVILGSGGAFLAFVVIIMRDNPPIGSVGGLIGWWLSGCVVIGIIAQHGSYQPQIGLYVAGAGAVASLLGSMALLISARPQTVVIPLPGRQWFAALALLMALALPVVAILDENGYRATAFAVYFNHHSFEISVGALILTVIFAIFAMAGEAGTKLRYPYRIIAAIALSLAIAEFVDSGGYLFYIFQHF